MRKAYELKNQLDEWFKKSNERIPKTGIEEWSQLVEKSNIESFQSVVKTFQRWKTEILNSFVYPYSNGYIEGETIQPKSSSEIPMALRALIVSFMESQMIREVSD